LLQLAELKWVESIKEILVKSILSDPISLKFPILAGEFNAENVSELIEWEEFPEMQRSYFLHPDDNSDTLKINNSYYKVSYAIGQWGRDRRINGAHICLGVEPLRFNSLFFAQLELSQMLEDGDSLYVVKNISKMAGEGASARLNKGTSGRAEQQMRRQLLKERLGWDSLEFEKHEWLVLCKIDKNKFDGNFDNEINTMILESFLKYAFTIEEIIKETGN